jgi:hypothetical protein
MTFPINAVERQALIAWKVSYDHNRWDDIGRQVSDCQLRSPKGTGYGLEAAQNENRSRHKQDEHRGQHPPACAAVLRFKMFCNDAHEVNPSGSGVRRPPTVIWGGS